MILANITSYIGQDVEAEHFYCSYDIVPDGTIPKKQYNGNDQNKLNKILDSKAAAALNRKDSTWKNWREGMETNRFDSIEEIHATLIDRFGGDIVTYEDYQVFKQMLCILNGENLGVDYFGEVWNTAPRSVWKDLLPTEFKIRCYDCKTEFKFEEVTDERELHGRTLVEFLKKRDLIEVDPCCRYFELEWNVIL